MGPPLRRTALPARVRRGAAPRHRPPGLNLLAVVLVVAAPPEAVLVAAERRAVEPLVHAPQAVEPARVRRVGVVDDAVLKRERAHAGPFPPVRLPVRPDDARCELVESGAVLAGRRPEVRLAEVVLGGARLPLLPGDGGLEVVVEVAAGRGRPGEAPAHPLPVGLQSVERGPRHRAERDIVIREVDDGAVEAVRDRRAGRAPCRVLGAEHEVIDEQLRASLEEIGERRCALVGVEAVLLVDPDPGQLLPPARQLVAAPGQRLLGLQQLQPGRQPLVTCSGLVSGHCSLLIDCWDNSLARPAPPAPPVMPHIGGVSPGTDAGEMTTTIPRPMIASASGTSSAAFGGSSFWARTTTAITTIQATLMTPSTASTSMSPMLEPTQHSPNCNPDPALSWQRRRKCCLTGVSSYTPAAITSTPAAAGPCGR